VTERYIENGDERVGRSSESGENMTHAASKSSGVHGGTQGLETRAETRESMSRQGSDERIQRYLREHLVHASHYPGLIDVMFEVKDGHVTLSGTVPHRVMKQSIEATTASCPGVKHVENNLNVALTAPWPDFKGVPRPLDQG
jgi:osmotically-inducible protein OsmY